MNLPQVADGALSLRQPTGKRVGRGADGAGGRMVWFLAQGSFRPFTGFVEAAGEKMRKSRTRLHMVGRRI
jgi:hypothetical protein